ncbi:MAG: DsbA family protein [Acidobacteriia bacterium]|nr:DsbA family protein [Terriglobia bacterium]
MTPTPVRPKRRENRIPLPAASTLLAAVLCLLQPGQPKPNLFAATGQTGTVKPAELYFCGNAASPIRIEVFSDYQCPHCRDFYLGIIKPLIKDYAETKKVYVVYHDFPLDMHPLARSAARLALAAMRLGRERWLRVTDALYTTQDQWAQDGKFDAVLAKVLDPAELVRLNKLASDPAIEVALAHELTLGRSRNITSTPTYFVITETGRQQRLTQVLPYPVIKDYIDRFLKQ